MVFERKSRGGRKMEEFKIKYQNAYEQIRPRADYLEELYAGYEKGQRNRREMFWKIMRPAAAVCVCIPVLLMTLLSVAASALSFIDHLKLSFFILHLFPIKFSTWLLPLSTASARSMVSSVILWQFHRLTIPHNRTNE